MNGNYDEGTLRILVIEPYYGGSHKHFLDGLIENLPFHFTLMTLPARKWKWRMRLSAPFFAEKLFRSNERYDRILCSTFLDVAAFRGLAPAWVQDTPVLTYFHENQFAYPVRSENERDFHFGITNLTTALASDKIAFNSRHNLESFLAGASEILPYSYDLQLNNLESKIRTRSKILYPGLKFSSIDRQGRTESIAGSPPVIVWNHRWEHDKNPRGFFQVLDRLKECGISFRIMVLGQRFKEAPKAFSRARQSLEHEIIHFGFVKEREEYLRLLARGDLVISTANHEFFGMAVIEAVRAGCRPLLPKRLSYPELFPEEYLYSKGELFDKLRKTLEDFRPLTEQEAHELTKRFSWNHLNRSYRKWLESCSGISTHTT